MSAAHTPGPWFCQSPDEDGTIFVIGSNLGGLVGAALCWPTEVETGGSDRVRANSRLIAAAPELLAALEAFVEGDSSDDMDTRYENASAAIAKALGRTPNSKDDEA